MYNNLLGKTATEININIITKFKLSLEQTKIWLDLQEFFFDKNNWNCLLKFLNSNSKISLRIIDYFLTSYCYLNTIEHNGYNIFVEYKNMLKKYHKKFFDPCSRGIKIPFFYNQDVCVITTICQINFFKWFIETKIYENFILNYDKIKKSMKINKNKSNNRNKKFTSFNDKNIIYCSTKKDIKAIFD